MHKKSGSSKLGLGAANIGSRYGKSSGDRNLSLKELSEILSFANSKNIRVIDTAKNYPNSETTLGSFDLAEFDLITKLPKYTNTKLSVLDWTLNQIYDSLRKLGVSKLYSVLLHDTSDLFSGISNELLSALQLLKTENFVEKIGISVYNTSEVLDALKLYDFDLVQIPANLADQRFQQSGTLDLLYRNGIEIHARSIFLQGLFLITEKNIPHQFNTWADWFKKYFNILNKNSVHPVHLCLNYPLSLSQISKVIVGVQTVSQLIEISNFSNRNILDINTDILQQNDENFINPSKWTFR